MTKAKYKIGQLVQFVRGEGHTTESGTLNCVLTYRDGFEYTVEGENQSFGESCITAAFREVKPRAPQGRRAKVATELNGTSSKKGKKSAAASAEA